MINALLPGQRYWQLNARAFSILFSMYNLQVPPPPSE